MPPNDSSTGAIGLAFVVLLIAGIGVASTAGSTSIASGYASKDGNTVHVRRAHQRFAEQSAALLPGPVPPFYQPYPQ